MYKDVWEAAVGEVLIYEREAVNGSDRYAVDVKRRNYCWTFAYCWTFNLDIYYCWTFNYSLYKIFREIYFRSLERLRKYFDNENFQIYGMRCFMGWKIESFIGKLDLVLWS